jgi:phosphatidate phosphatase PAH1
VASQLIEEVTAHGQSDSLEDVREIRADGTYFPNNPRIMANDGTYWAQWEGEDSRTL